MKVLKQVCISGRPAALVIASGRKQYFSPDTPAPVGGIVGQFASKFVSPSWRDDITDNEDESTHIDVDAWIEAFREVYSRS